MKITYSSITPWQQKLSKPGKKELEKNKHLLNSFFSFMLNNISQVYPLVSDDSSLQNEDDDYVYQLTNENETS